MLSFLPDPVIAIVINGEIKFFSMKMSRVLIHSEGKTLSEFLHLLCWSVDHIHERV
jgi:hypothetical protein